MIARFLGVRVWDLSKVAAHYQDEAAMILMAQHEARLHKQKEAVNGGAMNIDVFLPEI